MFDLCIIGAGMVGSAAARHATSVSCLKVCLIGPAEPEKRNADETRDIYGSYYDEGRITRCCDPDMVWADLAKQSINRYRDLEQRSGIQFYYEVGDLMIGGENSNYLANVEKVTSERKIVTEKLSNKSLQQRFPYLNIGQDTYGILETQRAGYINPRKLVEAQKVMAAKQNCTIIDDVVRRVVRIVQSDGSYSMSVETEGGRSIQCGSVHVLLATGAFTNLRDLLAGIIPDQIVTPLMTSLVEVDVSDQNSLCDMPCVIYKGQAHTKWKLPISYKGNDVLFYMLPPIQYPDGRYYIKLGLHGGNRESLKSSADVKRWFEGGDVNLAKDVATFTISLFKGLELKSWRGDSCVVTETATTRPYIDKVHAQLGVAIGGNGYAAKSSDEIGRLAVNMMLGKWDSHIPRDVFKLKTLPNSSVPSFSSHKSNL